MITLEEARKVVGILLEADHSCLVCARNLIEEFARQFPEYAMLAKKMYDREFPGGQQSAKGSFWEAPI